MEPESNLNIIPNSPLSVGKDHYAVIDDQGILYMAGKNDIYQLGDGTTNNSKIPIPLKSFSKKVIGVSCGKDFTIAITEDGKIYGWGFMEDSNDELMKVPTLIEGLESYRAVKVSCGGNGWGVILEDGSVYYSVWGVGLMRLETKGIIPAGDKIIDISADGYKFAVVTKSGNLYFFSKHTDYHTLKWPGEFPSQLKHIPLPEKIKQVSLSQTHVIVLTKNGNVYTWGNKSSLLGLGEDSSSQIYKIPQRLTSLPKISYISSSKKFSSVITTDGRLYVWGENKTIDKMGVLEDDDRFKMTQYERQMAIVPIGISIGYILSDVTFLSLDVSFSPDETFKVNYVAAGENFTLFSTRDGVVNHFWESKYGPN